MTSPPSFREVYHECKDLVYNLALQYVHNTDDAQDLTQEVFVKVHHHLHAFNPAAASITTWVYRITVNHCLDHLKARRTKKRFAFITSLFVPDSDGTMHDPGHFDHPGVLMEDAEELRNLFSLIDRLPLRQRTALILTKIEDRSQKEAAEIMEIPPKALESLVQRAKSNLSEMLEQQRRIDGK
ncbi:MAG: RNA polymerase sigma factor [Bacteroidetes bacterium]|nr:RNA polymerase sigma factor [Bacteroidota bacterium]